MKKQHLVQFSLPPAGNCYDNPNIISSKDLFILFLQYCKNYYAQWYFFPKPLELCVYILKIEIIHTHVHIYIVNTRSPINFGIRQTEFRWRFFGKLKTLWRGIRSTYSFSLRVSCNTTEISFCICWYHAAASPDQTNLSSPTKAVLTFMELSSLNPADT